MALCMACPCRTITRESGRNMLEFAQSPKSSGSNLNWHSLSPGKPWNVLQVPEFLAAFSALAENRPAAPKSPSRQSWEGGWAHYESYGHWVESLGSNHVAFDPWTENLGQCSVENIRVRLSVAIQKRQRPNQENYILQLVNEGGNGTTAALWDPATKYEKEDIKALLWCPLAQPYGSLGQIHPWFNMAIASGVCHRGWALCY